MKKNPLSKQTTFAAVGAGSAMLTGRLVQSMLDKGYRRYSHREKVPDPMSRDTPWMQAILWTAATAAIVAVAQMSATRGIQSKLDGGKRKRPKLRR